MVFDWFKRAAVPQSPAAVTPQLPPEPPPASESDPAPAPEGTAPPGGSEPSLEAGAGVDQVAAEPSSLQGAVSEVVAVTVVASTDGTATAQAPAVGAVDQEALDWARQAYARLKAQQEAARSAPAAQPIPSSPASSPALAASLPSGPAPEPTAAAEAEAVAQPSAIAESTVDIQQMPAAEQAFRPEPTPPDTAPAQPSAPVAEATVVAEPAAAPGFASGAELPAMAAPIPGAELSTAAAGSSAIDEVTAVAVQMAVAVQTAVAEQTAVAWPTSVAEPPAPQPAAVLAADSLSGAPAVARGLSLLEQAAAERQQRLQQLTAVAPVSERESLPLAAVAPPALVESEPQLGAFDDTFTWSAEVLAAQGRKVDDMSLEEIDWLGRLRRGLEKTRRGFVTQLLENLGDDPLTPEVIDDLETTLLRADVGVQATDQVLEALRRRLNEEVVDPAEGLRFLKEQLRGLLEAPIAASAAPLLAPQKDRLNVWLLVGVNGVGKTTTLGKLANLAVRSGYSCLIAAADTFRAAAVEQVRIWGERSGVAVISNPSANADPAAVVYDAIGAARAKGTELVLVDTAGRLQTKHNLMEELTKVRRIIDKLAPEAVVESLLVLDASQGQNGLRQAMAFASAAGLTGVVITKLDGSARGGVALAVASEARLPIRFIGAGEGIRDLRPFNSFEFVEALLAS